MDDYRDMDEAERKQELTEIKEMIEKLRSDNKWPEKLPSRELINIRLGHIIEKCDEAIDKSKKQLTGIQRWMSCT